MPRQVTKRSGSTGNKIGTQEDSCRENIREDKYMDKTNVELLKQAFDEIKQTREFF